MEIIRNAKHRGVGVTCETCPHYIAATEEMTADYDTSTKVNPPLRTENDRQAIIEGLVDGTIDAIATDHAPHHIDDKLVEYQIAAMGISGFETAFSLCYTHLVASKKITIEKLVELMCQTPAKILNISAGTLTVGANADITLIDESQTAGNKTILWDGKDAAGNSVPSGVYFYRIQMDGFNDVKKMLFLK